MRCWRCKCEISEDDINKSVAIRIKNSYWCIKCANDMAEYVKKRGWIK